jgi:hypothetical protein
MLQSTLETSLNHALPPTFVEPSYNNDYMEPVQHY